MENTSNASRTKTLLVVGDVMIDRTWLVSKTALSSTSQAHAGIQPTKVVSPAKLTDILGGAGAACTHDPSLHVKLMGEWNGNLNLPMLVPEGTDVIERIHPLLHATTRFTTEKWRIFSVTAAAP